MAKSNYTWTVNAGGVNHQIEYKGNNLIVDGEKYKLKSVNWFIRLIDYAINFGDVTCRLVVIGNKVDLAVNGTYVGSGEAYEPVGNIPIAVTVFAGISVVLGFLMNGWLGLALGAFIATLYFTMYLKKKSLTPVIIAFVIATICQLALGFGVSILLAAIEA